MPFEKIMLSEEDVEKIKELEPQLEWLASEIARAERAGIDVSELRKKFEEIVMLKEGLLREYAPKK